MKNNYKKINQNVFSTLTVNWVVVMLLFTSAFFTKTAFAQAPPAPVASSATNQTCTTFNANWSPVIGAVSYFIDVSTDVNFSTFVAGYQDFYVGGVPTYNISSLSVSDYYYRVRSFDGTNSSLNSNVILVSALLPIAPVAQSPPNITCVSFDASWSASLGGISYYLDVSTDAGFSSFLNGYNDLNVGNVTTYNVSGLTANVAYHYRLRSVNGCAFSVNSNVIAVSTGAPLAPVAAVASNLTCTSADANWGAAVGATTYYLDVSSDPTFGVGNFLPGYNNLNTGNVTAYNVTGLQTGVTYFYRVKAANGCATSLNSNSISTSLGTPPTLSSTLSPSPVCSGSAFSYTPTSSTSGTTFAWSRATVAGISNAVASGTGNPNEVLINTTTSAVNVTYVYTLTANGCTNSTTYSVVVAVNPSPIISSSLSPAPVCGGSTFNYTPTSATSGATFSWTRAMVSGISNAAANGTDDPNEVLVNTTTSPINVTYVYSLSANGCTNSTTYSVVVAVNPSPTLSSSLSPAPVCGGSTFNYTPTSATSGTTFSWTRAMVSGISNAAGSGTNDPSEILVNTTSSPVNVTYVYALTANGCTNSTTYSVVVAVNSAPTLSSTLTPAAVCGSSTFSYTPTSSTSGTTYAWTRAAVLGISNASASGAGGINEALIDTTGNPVNVTYVYTLTANGCTNSTTYSVVVTVNPGSNITLSSSLTPSDMYSGSVFNYIPTSATPGTTFAWARPTVVGISNASASGTDDPNEMLVNTTNAVVTVEYLYTLTANGCSNSSPDTVRVKILPIVVWPGDANNDMVVNNFDLLPLGLHFSQTGTPRASTANLWQAYMATNWGTNQNNGQDLMHVDCDGNGTIDNDDTLAINQNFSLTHLVSTPPVEVYSNERTTPDMYFVINSSAFNAGDLVPVELWLGSVNAPLTNLYGVAFNIHYDQNLVENATESLTYPTGWLGTKGTDMITVSKIDALTNTAYGAMVRNDQTSRSGYGKIAEFKFQVSNSLTADDTIKFSISSYMVVDSTGTAQTLTVGTDTVWVSPLSTGVANRKVENAVSVAPNPFSTNTTITFNTEVQNATVKVFDVVGKEVKVVNFSGKEFTLEKGDLNAGIYSVKIISANHSIIANQKIVIQ